MRKVLTVLAVLAASTALASGQILIKDSDSQRAAALVKQMTLEEKCLLVAGASDGFHTAAIDRLEIPSVRMADGPQGVRNDTRSTYYPCGISLAASFNRSVAHGVGTGIGFDARARGVGIMLCPGVNIYRTALCGRNFEYYGEDPFLASETAVQYIDGIQGKGVMATIKHFAANNQEYDRHGTSSHVDERTLNEIYFPAFRKAVEQAHVACVMTSYNPLNGTHAAENSWLIRENLRAWGHKGIVMSDWTSTYTTLGCLTSGLDLEMPHQYVLNYQMIKPLIDNGVVDEALLDEMCQNILQSFSAYGFLDSPVQDKSIPEDYSVSREYAYAAALEGPVMLKNDGILPLKASRKNNIVLLGPDADIIPFGGGSGRMDPIEGRTTTLKEGLEALGSKQYKTTFLKWEKLSKDDCKTISKASAVILSVGFTAKTEMEGADRTYTLPEGQNELIKKVASLNPNTIVIINSGGEVDILPWKDSVKAILMAWYAGQDGGRALADILSGKASPSGRLPFTFWGTLEKNPCYAYYHAAEPFKRKVNRDKFTHADYSEGVFVGYRGAEHFGLEPLYPFGYGLTYSTFEYNDLTVLAAADGFSLSFTVTNTGKVEASEVAQVYIAPVKPAVARPLKELKGYEKVRLAPGASANVTVTLPRSAFARYDTASHAWKVDKGEYVILVGASTEDIRLTSQIAL